MNKDEFQRWEGIMEDKLDKILNRFSAELKQVFKDLEQSKVNKLEPVEDVKCHIDNVVRAWSLRKVGESSWECRCKRGDITNSHIKFFLKNYMHNSALRKVANYFSSSLDDAFRYEHNNEIHFGVETKSIEGMSIVKIVTSLLPQADAYLIQVSTTVSWKDPLYWSDSSGELKFSIDLIPTPEFSYTDMTYKIRDTLWEKVFSIFKNGSNLQCWYDFNIKGDRKGLSHLKITLVDWGDDEE